MRHSGSFASAVVGGVMLLGMPAYAAAQAAASGDGADPARHPIGRVASFAPGTIQGLVHDEAGAPVRGAVVSALGATTTFAITDEHGRFELRTLTPGPYLVRAHLRGFVAPRPQLVDVRASARSTSSIALRRAGAAAPLLAAGFGALPSTGTSGDTAAAPADPAACAPADPADNEPRDDDHGETAWRLRHTRRGVLKNADIPLELLAGDEERTRRRYVLGGDIYWAVASPARVAGNFLVDTPFSGQVNLLTTSTFDAPRDLFSGDVGTRGIAFLQVGAPVGEGADWSASGAFNQSDISSWFVAGSYVTRVPATHRYDVGLSYSTQRYDGGNPLALRDVADGARNAGTIYGYDTFTLGPELSLTYGARYARYDYLENRNLISPRIDVTLTPADRTRVSATVALRSHAPGAEEFLPPGETGIWLPPQRTFSSLADDHSLNPERTFHMAVEVQRDIAGSTISVRAFRQHVEDQLVTLFGTDLPSQPSARLGHYLVGNAGEADAVGYGAGFRTVVAGRVHGSVDYSLTTAQLTSGRELSYLVLMAPSALRSEPERIHDLATSVETNVPETATRVLVVYRISNGFARPARGGQDTQPGLDSRFDVQVRQSLPFMNFSNAKWEMLLAVRNFFRETAPHQSVYDELLVVQPPKRIVGGVTLHF